MITSRYHPTGNQYLSLPSLVDGNAGIERLNSLSMRCKGLLEFSGTDDQPLLRPLIIIGGKEQRIENPEWQRRQYWLPEFTWENDDVAVAGLIFAPLDHRGFVYRLSVRPKRGGPADVEVGFAFHWAKVTSRIYASKPIYGMKTVGSQGWGMGLALEFSAPGPVCSLVLAADRPEKLTWSGVAPQAVAADTPLSFRALLTLPGVAAGQTETTDFCFGLGQEEFSAATSVVEMRRQRISKLLDETTGWLTRATRLTGDAKLDDIANKNYFFNYFFATGVTLDTEELVLVTSRSHRYYVSAAYWDRDSLLWSFPSVVQRDPAQARRMLEYVFQRQIRNVGVHCRYIDGTVLEPGFELDELCAPVLALKRYWDLSGDKAVLSTPWVQAGLDRILAELATRRHPRWSLYETLSSPSDDFAEYPYLCYDNVLAWRMLNDCDAMYRALRQAKRAAACAALAGPIRRDVLRHLVVDGPCGKMFAWAIDSDGRSQLFDEPPGSLKLLPHYGFCGADDPVYRNTVAWIHSPHNPYSFHDRPLAEVGCAHAAHPWTLGLCNSLLSGRGDEAAAILRRIPLDNGFACESFNEHTGAPETGEAFATCAGFLAYALGEYGRSRSAPARARKKPSGRPRRRSPMETHGGVG